MNLDESVFPNHPCQKKGWLLPSLVRFDATLSKRWEYWLNTLDAGQLLAQPIPQIHWLFAPHPTPQKNLTDVLSRCPHQTAFEAFRLFVDWLLYALGDASVDAAPSGIDPSLHLQWYETFNLGLYLKHPYDYLGHYAADLYSSGRRNPTAYFPTPMHLSVCMAKMVMGVEDKTASVCDPCVGSGRLLMAASNYSLNLYGMDIDLLIVKVCRINMWWYVPWCIYRPKTLKGIEWVSPPLSQTDTLEPHPVRTLTPQEHKQLEKAIQLELFSTKAGSITPNTNKEDNS